MAAPVMLCNLRFVSLNEIVFRSFFLSFFLSYLLSYFYLIMHRFWCQHQRRRATLWHGIYGIKLPSWTRSFKTR